MRSESENAMVSKIYYSENGATNFAARGRSAAERRITIQYMIRIMEVSYNV